MGSRAAHENNGKILFDPSVTCKTDLAECFHIFTDPLTKSDTPATRLTQVARGCDLPHKARTVYTDGSCINNGKENARCGSGIWVEPNHLSNRAIRIPGPHQSNQVVELVALIVTLELTENCIPLTIMTDSRYVIEGLTRHLHRWEDNGWIGVENSAFFKKATALLRYRSAETWFQWVKGHNGDLGNEKADQYAKEGAEKDDEDELDLSIPIPFNLPGAKISTITQSIAYQGAKQIQPVEPRRQAVLHLGMACAALEEYTGHSKTDASLWLGCLSKDLRHKPRQFIFKILHNAYKVGAYWEKIPNYAHWAPCSACGDTESLEHIFTECSDPTADTV